MQTIKNPWTLRCVCAAILLLACCFRTAAVLSAPSIEVPMPDFSLLQYSPAPIQKSVQYDAEYVSIENRAGVNYDIDALLAAPLEIEVGDEPVILIIHTHATESYAEIDGYRSEDPSENMIRIGEEIAQILNAQGICTLHDTALHDAGGYDTAYERTEIVISEYLQKYPGIRMVIDVHRDAVQGSDGTQIPLRTILRGESMAQLLLVMGTDTAELPHPNWEQNLSFAVKLQAYISAQAPDLFRQTVLRPARYNEHMTPYSILLEVGTAGNTQQEALRSARYFAQQLANLLLSQ